MGKNVQFFFGKFCLKDNNSPPSFLQKLVFFTYGGPIGNWFVDLSETGRGPIGNRFVDLSETGSWT